MTGLCLRSDACESDESTKGVGVGVCVCVGVGVGAAVWIQSWTSRARLRGLTGAELFQLGVHDGIAPEAEDI